MIFCDFSLKVNTLVIALVIALNFGSTDSIIDVLKNWVVGLTYQWIQWRYRWKIPSKSSISEARQRVGSRVMTRLFEKVARPLATLETETAFLNGLRWMALDGSTLDMPDTEENGRVFGYPGTRKGTHAAFPKARLVILGELGTHLITDALISPYRIGFTGTLKILRRAIPLFQAISPTKLPLFVLWLIEEIKDQKISPRQGRTHPRVVKKPRSKFKSRKRCHRGHGTQLQPLTFAISQPLSSTA